MPSASFIAGLSAAALVARGNNTPLSFTQNGATVTRTPNQIIQAINHPIVDFIERQVLLSSGHSATNVHGVG